MEYEQIKEEELEIYIEKLMQLQDQEINELYDNYYR